MSYLLTAVIIILVIIILSASIKVVREYQRLVVFRLGRSIGARGPGLVFLIPIVDKPVWTDLRELYLEIPSQTCITKDNAPIDIDFLIYWRVMDPSLSVIQVANFAGASQGIATTTLRAVIGDIPLDDVLAKREDINRVLRTKLDEVTERWGVKVTTRGDPGDRSAQGHPGRHEPPDVRGAQQARHGHRERRKARSRRSLWRKERSSPPSSRPKATVRRQSFAQKALPLRWRRSSARRRPWTPRP